MKATGDYVRRACVCLASLAATLSLCIAQADDLPADPVRTFNIAAQPLSKALLEFSKQSGLVVTVPSALVEGKTAPEIHGALPSSQALEKLLSGSGLKASRTSSGGISIGNTTTSGAGHTSNSTSQWASANGQLAQTVGPQPATSSDSTRSVALSGNQAENNDRLSEIIVTAQKRSERLQDVPVPVTALSAQELVDTNQFRLQDYYTRVPGLQVFPTPYGLAQITIRGLTSGSFANPTVSVLVDDVPINKTDGSLQGSQVAEIDPSDLQGIEVLRGPQGTLYGSSSLGGLLKYVTIDPSPNGIDGFVQVGGTRVFNATDTGYSARGAINLPLGDSLAVRASGYHRFDPGYIDDPAYGRHGVNSTDSSGGHVSLLWQPTSDFSMKWGALIQDTTTHGSSEVDLLSGLGDLQQQRIPGYGGSDTRFQLYTLNLKAKFGLVDVTAISGYDITKTTTSYDFTQSLGTLSQSQFQVPGASFLGTPFLNDPVQTDKFTQELRASLPLGQHVDWLLGTFYSHERNQLTQDWPAVDPTSGAVVGSWYHGYFAGAVQEYAVFSDVTFHPTERFNLQVGGRETWHNQNIASYSTGIAPLGSDSTSPRASSNDTAFTYLLTPQFKFTPDLMVYARLASGFRAGGPNTSAQIDPGLPKQYSPDKTTNYEIGTKGDWFNHKLSFDASLYYIDWRNIQVLLNDTNPNFVNSFLNYTGNAGKAKSDGLELSFEAKPLTGMTISAWGTWGTAELTEDFPVTSTVVAHKGDALPFSSRFSGNVAVDQRFGLTDSLTALVGASLSYVGQRAAYIGAVGPNEYPAYARTDLSAGLLYGDWKLNFFVNNVADRRGVLYYSTFIPTAVGYIQPRTVGLLVSRSF